MQFFTAMRAAESFEEQDGGSRRGGQLVWHDGVLQPFGLGAFVMPPKRGFRLRCPQLMPHLRLMSRDVDVHLWTVCPQIFLILLSF